MLPPGIRAAQPAAAADGSVALWYLCFSIPLGIKTFWLIMLLNYDADMDYFHSSDENGYLARATKLYFTLSQHGISGLVDYSATGFHTGYEYLSGTLYWLIGSVDPRIMYLFNFFASVAAIWIMYRLLRRSGVSLQIASLACFFTAISPEFTQYTIVNMKESVVLLLWVGFFYAVIIGRLRWALLMMLLMAPFRFYLIVPELLFVLALHGFFRSLLVLLVLCAGMMAADVYLSWGIFNIINPDKIVSLATQDLSGWKGLFDPSVPSSYIYLPMAILRIFLSPLPWQSSGFQGMFSYFYYFKWFSFPFFLYGCALFLYAYFRAGRRGPSMRILLALGVVLAAVLMFYVIFAQQSAVRHRLIIEPIYYLFTLYAIRFMLWRPASPVWRRV